MTPTELPTDIGGWIGFLASNPLLAVAIVIYWSSKNFLGPLLLELRETNEHLNAANRQRGDVMKVAKEAVAESQQAG